MSTIDHHEQRTFETAGGEENNPDSVAPPSATEAASASNGPELEQSGFTAAEALGPIAVTGLQPATTAEKSATEAEPAPTPDADASRKPNHRWGTPRQRKLAAAAIAVVTVFTGLLALPKHDPSEKAENTRRPAAAASLVPVEETASAAPITPEATHNGNSPKTIDEAEVTGVAPDTVLSGPGSGHGFEFPQPYDAQALTIQWNGKEVSIPRVWSANSYLHKDTPREVHPSLKQISYQVMTMLSAIYSTPVGTPKYNELVASFTQDPEVIELFHDQAEELQRLYPGSAFFVFPNDDKDPSVVLGPEKARLNNKHETVQDFVLDFSARIRRVAPQRAYWGNAVDFMAEDTFARGDSVEFRITLGMDAVPDPAHSDDNFHYMSLTGAKFEGAKGASPYQHKWIPFSSNQKLSQTPRMN